MEQCNGAEFRDSLTLSIDLVAHVCCRNSSRSTFQSISKQQLWMIYIVLSEDCTSTSLVNAIYPIIALLFELMQKHLHQLLLVTKQ